MPYFLSPALAKLRDQVQVRWPHRDRTSDGWIGDTSHAARPSDHNPDWSDGGIVRAIDIDEDLVIGMAVVGEAQPLADALLRDARTRYVIYEGRISYGQHVTGVTHGWRPYSGTNAHRHHIHISVRDVGGHDRDTRAWALSGSDPTPPPTGGFMAELNEREQKRLLKNTDKILDLVDDQVIDGPAGKPKEQDPLTVTGGIRRLLIEQRAGFARAEKRDAAQTTIIRTLAESKGIDPEALLKLLGDKIDAALADVEITLTTKES